ncbi:hypothetical protein DFH27DRAFT_68147 [Peziza echinospora]|nr:hypothetical protein DFH27DRAFT_68147 [Peziza echinospora]
MRCFYHDSLISIIYLSTYPLRFITSTYRYIPYSRLFYSLDIAGFHSFKSFRIRELSPDFRIHTEIQPYRTTPPSIRAGKHPCTTNFRNRASFFQKMDINLNIPPPSTFTAHNQPSRMHRASLTLTQSSTTNTTNTSTAVSESRPSTTATDATAKYLNPNHTMRGSTTGGLNKRSSVLFHGIDMHTAGFAAHQMGKNGDGGDIYSPTSSVSSSPFSLSLSSPSSSPSSLASRGDHRRETSSSSSSSSASQPGVRGKYATGAELPGQRSRQGNRDAMVISHERDPDYDHSGHMSIGFIDKGRAEGTQADVEDPMHAVDAACASGVRYNSVVEPHSKVTPRKTRRYGVSTISIPSLEELTQCHHGADADQMHTTSSTASSHAPVNVKAGQEFVFHGQQQKYNNGHVNVVQQQQHKQQQYKQQLPVVVNQWTAPGSPFHTYGTEPTQPAECTYTALGQALRNNNSSATLVGKESVGSIRSVAAAAAGGGGRDDVQFSARGWGGVEGPTTKTTTTTTTTTATMASTSAKSRNHSLPLESRTLHHHGHHRRPHNRNGSAHTILLLRDGGAAVNAKAAAAAPAAPARNDERPAVEQYTRTAAACPPDGAHAAAAGLQNPLPSAPTPTATSPAATNIRGQPHLLQHRHHNHRAHSQSQSQRLTSSSSASSSSSGISPHTMPPQRSFPSGKPHGHPPSSSSSSHYHRRASTATNGPPTSQVADDIQASSSTHPTYRHHYSPIRRCDTAGSVPITAPLAATSTAGTAHNVNAAACTPSNPSGLPSRFSIDDEDPPSSSGFGHDILAHLSMIHSRGKKDAQQPQTQSSAAPSMASHAGRISRAGGRGNRCSSNSSFDGLRSWVSGAFGKLDKKLRRGASLPASQTASEETSFSTTETSAGEDTVVEPHNQPPPPPPPNTPADYRQIRHPHQGARGYSTSYDSSMKRLGRVEPSITSLLHPQPPPPPPPSHLQPHLHAHSTHYAQQPPPPPPPPPPTPAKKPVKVKVASVTNERMNLPNVWVSCSEKGERLWMSSGTRGSMNEVPGERRSKWLMLKPGWRKQKGESMRVEIVEAGMI